MFVGVLGLVDVIILGLWYVLDPMQTSMVDLYTEVRTSSMRGSRVKSVDDGYEISLVLSVDDLWK